MELRGFEILVPDLKKRLLSCIDGFGASRESTRNDAKRRVTTCGKSTTCRRRQRLPRCQIASSAQRSTRGSAGRDPRHRNGRARRGANRSTKCQSSAHGRPRGSRPRLRRCPDRPARNWRAPRRRLPRHLRPAYGSRWPPRPSRRLLPGSASGQDWRRMLRRGLRVGRLVSANRMSGTLVEFTVFAGDQRFVREVVVHPRQVVVT